MMLYYLLPMLSYPLSYPHDILMLQQKHTQLLLHLYMQINLAFAHLRHLAADSVVILISHRLYLFPELDRVIWLENGEAKVGTHEELVGNTPDYAAQFDAQREENSHE